MIEEQISSSQAPAVKPDANAIAQVDRSPPEQEWQDGASLVKNNTEKLSRARSKKDATRRLLKEDSYRRRVDPSGVEMWVVWSPKIMDYVGGSLAPSREKSIQRLMQLWQWTRSFEKFRPWERLEVLGFRCVKVKVIEVPDASQPQA